MFVVTIPGKPVPKARARAGGGNNGRHYTPRTTVLYEKHVRSVVQEELLAYRELNAMCPSPARWGIAAVYFLPDERRRDLDNLLKALLDALNGVLWRDDTQVVAQHAIKRVDRDRPRVELYAHPLVDKHAIAAFYETVRGLEHYSYAPSLIQRML